MKICNEPLAWLIGSRPGTHLFFGFFSMGLHLIAFRPASDADLLEVIVEVSTWFSTFIFSWLALIGRDYRSEN